MLSTPQLDKLFRSESVVQLTHDVRNESASLLRHVHREELLVLGLIYDILYLYMCMLSSMHNQIHTLVAALHTYMQQRVAPKHTFVPMP